MWENTPIKTIYVFSKRVNPMRNGSEVDEKGKPWASTMCLHGLYGNIIMKACQQ